MNVFVAGSVTAVLSALSFATPLVAFAYADDDLQKSLNDSAEPVLPAPVAANRVGQNDPSPVLIASVTTGLASWYGPGFHGRRSASGEIFDQYALTAAHRTLPFGTKVRVTNLKNGRQVTVRVNDRGPYNYRRVIDLSAGAAASIDMVHSGVAQVRLEVLVSH